MDLWSQINVHFIVERPLGVSIDFLLGLTIVQNQNMEQYMTIILIVLLTVIFYFENSVSVTPDQFVSGNDLI